VRGGLTLSACAALLCTLSACAALLCTACKTEPTGPDPSTAARKLSFVHAAPGDVATIVRETSARERKLGRTTLVYVGATWCEPCQAFHKAAASGALDATFPTLTLVEFDLDADRPRLVQAGYQSHYIPLFTKPNEDGTASKEHVEGGIKGDGAVAYITGKLQTLVR
jgi:thiol-disulfide isomerase/thioredoxin